MEYFREFKANMNKKKSEKAKRYRTARADARVGSIIGRIESDYGLPQGSVSILNPNGRKARVDSKISNVRKKWDL